MEKHRNHQSIVTRNPKTSAFVALLVAGLPHVDVAQAAAVNTGDRLSITTGVPILDNNANAIISFTGSYFAMDYNINSKISNDEKSALSQGTTGLVIGTPTSPGASHGGAPVADDTNAIDAPFEFFGTTGSHYLTVAVNGNTTGGLDLSGWRFTYNGLTPGIPLGSGAWQPLNCSTTLGCTGHTFTDGNAMFTWDGIYGDAYTLNYTATVPHGDPSGFGGVQYYLHLEGTVNAVPVPAAVWLFGSGLLGLLGLARRRKT
jgi:hypothetical protein